MKHVLFTEMGFMHNLKCLLDCLTKLILTYFHTFVTKIFALKMQFYTYSIAYTIESVQLLQLTIIIAEVTIVESFFI